MPLKKSKLKRAKFALKLVALSSTFGIIGIGGVFAYYAKDLPSPGRIEELTIAQSSKIYDRTGNVLLYDIHGEQKRTVIPFAQIPYHAKIATIVAEDDGFYTHFGIDMAGVARAILTNLKGKTVLQGGSTITQQLIKNIYLSPERTLSRKIKEVILALEMEFRYSKDEILNFYLNAVPYGSNAYGIEAASQTFFQKQAKDLTLAQSALLASLPKAPTYYSPFGNNPEELKRRQEYILNRMNALGYISGEDSSEAKNADLSYSQRDMGIKAPHFVMYVREYLAKTYGEEYLKSSGITVITTLDWELQQEAEKIVKSWAEKNEKRFRAKNAALVALDPSSGQILAMVGSRDYFDTKNDGNVNVTTRLRQPGSSFKPFAYARAFEKGYTPDTILFDVETNFGVQGAQVYVPGNYDGKFRGPMRLKEALAQSINIPSVKVLYLAGVKETIALAKSMGITSLNDPARYGLSLVLGGGEVTLLDETSAYGVFAKDGVRHGHTAILSIVGSDGRPLEKFQDNPNKIIEPQIARLINAILSDNSLRAPIFGEITYLNLEGIVAAAKTGTTQEYRDGWTVGYTQDIAAGVWVGNNSNSKMADNADGVRVAAPIWHDFMKKAYEIKGWSSKQFPAPNQILSDKPVLNGAAGGALTIAIDKISGKRATEFTPPELIEERLFSEPHSILYFVQKNDPQGPPPQSPSDDPQFALWEEGIQRWTEEFSFSGPASPSQGGPPQEYDDVHTAQTLPRISILAPGPLDTLERGGNTQVLFHVENFFPVQRIEIFLDEEILKTISDLAIQNRDYAAYVKIPPSQKNIRTMKVRVFDTALNRAEAEVAISLR